MKHRTKQALSWLLSLALMLSLLPGMSLTAYADETKVGDATYTINNGVLTVGSGSFTIENWASAFGTGGAGTTPNATAKSIKTVVFQEDAVLTSTSMKNMFRNWTVLESVDLTNLTASAITEMTSLFWGCSKLTSVIFGAGVETSKVKDMGRMFRDCSSLTELDLSTFKAYTGTDKRSLYQTFYGCSNLVTIRVSDDWSVEKTEGNATFSGCNKLEGGKGTKAANNSQGNYSYAVIDGKDGQEGFFTSASAPVEHRHNFSYSASVSGSTLTATCSASDCGLTDNKVELTLTPPAKTVYGDSNSAAATLEGREAFNEATGLNIGSSQYYEYYKKGSDTSTSAPTTPGEYTVKVTISNVAGSSYTLTADYIIAQKEVGLTWADTTFHYDGKSHVPTATATGLVGSDKCDVTVTGEQTAIGTYTATASGLSNGWYKLPENTTTEFAIEGWVGTARYTIEEAPSPKKLFAAKSISHEITNGVLTIYDGEFTNADWRTAFANDDFIANTRDSITSVKFVKNSETQAVAKLTDSAQGMFQNWSKLESVDFSGLDTSSVTWMGTMFAECSSLTELDLSPLDTKNVTNMSNMFYKCSKLEKITVGANWKTASSTSHMFSGCNELAGNAGTTYQALFGGYINTDDNPNNPTLPDVNGKYAHVDKGTIDPGFFYNAHEHRLTYTVDQSKPWTITATCDVDGCYLGDSSSHSVSISLVKPTLYVYWMDELNKKDGEYDKGASPLATLTMQNVGDQTLKDSTTVADPDGKINGVSFSVATFNDANTAAPDFKALTGADIGSIEYYVKGSVEKLAEAPTDAGTYTAKVTIGDATASVDYRIYKRFHSPVLTSPTKNLDFAFGETEQELIIPGTIKQVDDTDTSTFEYALGDNATTIPAADKWSKDIPKGKGEGPFYVFYRVAGDKNHGSAMESEFPNKTGYANTTNPEHESNSYKPAFSVLIINKTAPTPPTPNELDYNGGDQALVTAGSTTTGKMQYALGEIKSEQPTAEQGDTTPIVIEGENKYMWKTGDWSDTVPQQTEPGVYYVLYRVVSNETPEVTIAEPAYVTATIGKGVPTAVAPTATATYGKTLKDVTLDNPTDNTAGTWAWVDAATTSVGDVGTNSFKAKFTPNDANHYKAVEVDVPVTVNKADLTGVSVTQNGTLIYTGEAQTPEVTAAATAVNDQSVTFTYSKTQDGEYGEMPTVTNVSDGGFFYYKASAPNHNVATGSFTVTVGKADPTAPTGLTATYGQTLENVTLPDGWTWADSTQSVGNVIDPATTFKANFAGNDNYNAASNVDVTVTVGKAEPTAPTGLTATYGQTLADVTLPNGWTWADSTQSVGNVVDPATTFKANFAGNDNYNAASNVDVTVTVGKADPTAPTGLTATYGQTLANVTLPTGWTWADSTQSVGNVIDPATTFKANFTGNDNYNAATNVDVTVTVGKANAVAATVTANSRTYDGTEKPLVTVTGEAAGGEMQYALGTATEATEPYATSIPAKTDAGTYYVWYKAGDENHNDTVPAYVTVTIAKAVNLKPVLSETKIVTTSTSIQINGFYNASTLAEAKYQYSLDGGKTWQPKDGTTNTTCTFSNLTGGTTYQLRVCTVETTHTVGVETSDILSVTTPAKNVELESVSISGDAKVGNTLSAKLNPSDATSVTYQWQSSDSESGTYSNISGATYATYALTQENYNKFIRVMATQSGKDAQTSAPVRAGKAPAVATADSSIRATATNTSITVTAPRSTATRNYEYSLDNANWQTENVFKFAAVENDTPKIVYVRTGGADWQVTGTEIGQATVSVPGKPYPFDAAPTVVAQSFEYQGYTNEKAPALSIALKDDAATPTFQYRVGASASGQWKEWTEEAANSLSVGSNYYMRADIDGNNIYHDYTTEPVTFTVTKSTTDARTAPTDPVVSDNSLVVTIAEADRGKALEYQVDGTAGQWVSVPTLNSNGQFTLGALSAESHTIYLRYRADSNYANPSNSVVSAPFNLTQYSVAYDANGGSNAPAPQTATSPNKIKVYTATDKAHSPTRSGYTFTGWFTAKTAGEEVSGTEVAASATYYAQWRANTYTIAFNANGGTGTMTSISDIAYDAAQTLTTNAFSNDTDTFVGWATSANGPVIYTDKQNVKNLTTGTGTVTLYAVWVEDNKTVSGTVESGYPGSVELKLMRGNTQVGGTQVVTLTLQASGDDAGKYTGTYSFTGVPNGSYNLVAMQVVAKAGEAGDYEEALTRTAAVTVSGSGDESKVSFGTSDTTGRIVMPSGDTSSLVEVKEDTPPVIVGGLDTVAKDQKVEDRSVNVTMSVESQDKTKKDEGTKDAIDAIENLNSVAKTEELSYLNIGIKKEILKDGVIESTEAVTQTPNVITIYIPYDMTGKETYQIMFYRHHIDENGTASTSALTRDSAPSNTDGHFYVDKAGNMISLYTNQFSTYAIGYNPDAKSPTHGSSSNSGATYAPTVSNPANGVVSISPTAPKAGDKVTITAKPNEGFEVDTVTVTDANGKAVSVTKVNDTTYTFTQPSGKVKVDVTFKEGSTTDALAVFSDVNASDWYAEAVRWALDNGVMNGVGNGKFNPNGDTSRAMIVTMLWRLEGSPTYAGASEFSDVDNEQWYGQAVRWANAEGIVKGDNGKFIPNGAVTREQLATMLYRYAQYKKADVSATASLGNYGDAQTVSSWATSAMQWAVGSGIINGIGSELVPAGNASRAQVATMLMRYSTNAAK